MFTKVRRFWFRLCSSKSDLSYQVSKEAASTKGKKISKHAAAEKMNKSWDVFQCTNLEMLFHCFWIWAWHVVFTGCQVHIVNVFVVCECTSQVNRSYLTLSSSPQHCHVQPKTLHSGCQNLAPAIVVCPRHLATFDHRCYMSQRNVEINFWYAKIFLWMHKCSRNSFCARWSK